MTIKTIGAATRPTLSPRYEGSSRAAAPRPNRRSPTLSTLELRRLVAEMVG